MKNVKYWTEDLKDKLVNHHASVQQVVAHTRFIWVKVFDGSTNIIFIILTLHGFLYVIS